MNIVTGTQMQALDRRTILEAHIPGAVLMERAGTGAAAFIEQRFAPLRGKIIKTGSARNISPLASYALFT